jgi:GAF domain-containing protein
MDSMSELASSISAATRTLNHRRTVDETLQAIAQVTRDSVPGFDQVGISTLPRHGKVVTRAFSGDLVLRLDAIQYELWQGPCVDVLKGSELVTASVLRAEQRWARYVPQAVALGVRSQLAMRLHHDLTIGSINLYSTVSDDVSNSALALAGLVATQSAVALGHAQERATLSEALQSRTVIGEAIGILMERYDMDEDHAFAFLVRASSHANVKLRTVAQELVDDRDTWPPRSART